jgi:CheY-like chemotaxis protein
MLFREYVEPRAPRVETEDTMSAEPPDLSELINEVGDDRDNIQPGDKVLLIVENNLDFARFVLDTAREKGYKGLVTSLGAAALALAQEYMPVAITLDLFLPDIEGWRVLERLKNEAATRHIPVCVISTDDAHDRALREGALYFVGKPMQSKEVLEKLLDDLRKFIGRSSRHVLLIEHDPIRRRQIMDYLGSAEDMVIADMSEGSGIIERIRKQPVDGIIVDPCAPGIDPLTLMPELDSAVPGARCPVFVYGDAGAANNAWDLLARGDPRVRRVHSLERLLDQSVRCLHRNVALLPDEQQQTLQDIYESSKPLAGRKALIVDDDMRNIFALSSVLEDHAMHIVSADSGREAISLLQEQQDIDVVLMDIMMPEMDGMETMREIRKFPAFKNLPIIAVTAKAMKGDRDRCIEAGAWDYLSKPVDTGQMLAVLRAWLHR